MKWLNFIPPKDLLEQIEGIEKGLQQNKRIGKLGWIGFILFLLPILAEVIKWWEKINWESIKAFPWVNLLDPAWVWQQITLGYIVLIPIIALTVSIVLIIWNRFWLKESNAPFRYTFSLEDLKAVLGEEAVADKNMALLSHHLCDKINERIGRLLLLDEKYLKSEDKEDNSTKNGFPQSHIHISGHYSKRKDRHRQWMLEIMPRVRIGPPGNPETLAYPIRYPLLANPNGQGVDEPPAIPLNSDTEKYEQILERLYFTVATEIYKQIQLNVKHKIDLLPRDYFRAVALFYEAEDYAHSNTLEAYDEARKLYEQAIQHFDPALKPLSPSQVRRTFQQFLRVGTRLGRGMRYLITFIFPRLGKREIMLAQAELGYARMLLFRRNLAGILGQEIYPVFETRPVAERAVRRLEKLPADVPGKNKHLFDACVITALAWCYMGSIPDAKAWLNRAEMLDPNRAVDNANYNFVYGEVEAHLRTELQIFQRVVELQPRFEVAQFSLAIKAEKLWRTRPSLERNVAETVLKQYEEVLKLNPGNVGAWANRGYIRWLLGGEEDIREAREDFLRGREYKEIKREIFVAELDHGLARICAEEGDFVSAYSYYTSATSANVTQAISNYIEYYFDLIGDALFHRYEKYLETVERHWETWKDVDEPYRESKETSENSQRAANKRVRNSILAFAYNDYGDACYHFYRRDGDERLFNKARAAYERAVQLNPAFVISLLNLQRLTTWKWDYKTSRQYLERVSAVEPNWPDGKIALAEVNSRLAEEKQREAEKEQKKASEKQQESARLKTEIGKLQIESEQLREKILRRRDQRVSSKTVYSAGETDKQAGGNLSLKTGYFPGSLSQPSREQSFDTTAMGISTLSGSESPEERRLQSIEREVGEWEEKCEELQKEFRVHEQNRDNLRGESEALAQEALEILKSLLPHQYFWVRNGEGKRFNFKQLSSGNNPYWRKELSNLHVHTLYYLGVVLQSKKQVEEAETVFSHIQWHYWPTQAYELRNILKDRLYQLLFEDPVYSDLKQNDLYCRLLKNEEYFKFLQEDRRLKLIFYCGNYRKLIMKPGFRALLWSKEHRDLLRYFRFNQIHFALGENWALELFYPYWALNYSAFDEAFSADRQGPLIYRGIKLKELKDFFTEAANETNRSKYFYYWLGHKLIGLEFSEEGLDIWQQNCYDSKDPHILLQLAEGLKSLERWKESLEMYRRALEYDQKYEEQSKWYYHHQCGSLLWAMQEYREALSEFDDIKSGSVAGSRWINGILDEILPHTNTPESYYPLKVWLESQGEYFARKGKADEARDAHSAAMRLLQEKYRQIRLGETVSPGTPAPSPMLSVVTPVAVEVDARMFQSPAPEFSDDHPLMKNYYPEVKKRAADRIGISIPSLRVRLNDSGMAENTYTIIIMEVPIVMGTAYPGKRFLPEHQKYSEELALHQITSQAAYDPLTGETSGAWMETGELEKLPVPITDTLDCFEYMACHLEAVISERFASFLDFQHTADLLASWQIEKSAENSEMRQELIAQSLPDLAAKQRFPEMLHWLLKESVPILNWQTLLETFKRANSPKVDIIDIVEATRLALKENLPGNDASQQFIGLSGEFEEEVRRNIRTSDGKIFFAIEPQPTQELLAAARAVLQNQRQWKTVIVTRSEGVRFHIRRLLEIEFPRVKILSIQELKPELRKRISKTISYSQKNN